MDLMGPTPLRSKYPRRDRSAKVPTASKGKQAREKATLSLLAFYSEKVTEPTPRRRVSLDDLRSDLAQVAPAKTEEDLDLFASELRLLLSSSESDRQKGAAVLDKKALWDRVTAEIDRHEEESAGADPLETPLIDGPMGTAEPGTAEPLATNDPDTRG